MTGERVGMHKYLKQIVVTIIIIALLASSIFYLQYGREIDASGSYYSGDTLSFNVTLNRLWFNASDQDSIESNILKKYKKNSFHSVRFSTDLMHPKTINVSVYLNDKNALQSEPLFTFSTDI